MDMRADDERPDFCSLGHMRRHLKRHGACWGAMQAAPPAWHRYRRWCERRAPDLATQSLPNT